MGKNETLFCFKQLLKGIHCNSSEKVDEMDKNQIYQKYKQCVLNAKQKIHYWEI